MQLYVPEHYFHKSSLVNTFGNNGGMTSQIQIFAPVRYVDILPQLSQSTGTCSVEFEVYKSLVQVHKILSCK